MFNFFHSIVGKIAAAVSGLVLLFSGATATPPTAEDQRITAVGPSEQVINADDVTTASSSPVSPSKGANITKNNAKPNPTASKATEISKPVIGSTSPVQPPIPASPPVQIAIPSASADEQAAIDYFNTHDSCNGIPDNQLKYCAPYSINHVSTISIQRREQAAAEADRLAAERAAQQKKEQLELDAYNAKIELNPVTCSYVALQKSLYCENLSRQTYNVESSSFTLVSSDELNKKFTSGKFAPAIRVSDTTKVVFSGTIRDREPVTIKSFIPLPGTTASFSSNNRIVLSLDFCASGVGCTYESDFVIVFNSVSGRFSDGTEFSPKIQMK